MRDPHWRTQFVQLFDPRVPYLFLIGLVCTAILSNAAYQLLTTIVGVSIPALLAIAVLALLALLVVALILNTVLWARQRGAQVAIDFAQEARPHRGLILCVSPGDENQKAAGFALRHHHVSDDAAQRLSRAWLLVSAEAQTPAAALAEDYRARGVQVELRPLTDAYDAQESYNVVRQIVAEAATDAGGRLAVDDLIVDITSGTRPMAMGAMVAAQQLGCDMEYMKALRDANGDVVRDVPPRAMQVNINVAAG